MCRTLRSGFPPTLRVTRWISRKEVAVPRNLPDLVRLFDSLTAPSMDVGAGRFSVLPVPGIAACAVGKDVSGLPVLVIETDAAEPRGTTAPLVLEHLSVLHNVDCRFQQDNAEFATRRLSVIRCCDSERVFHEYFLRALIPVLCSLPATPSRQNVVTAVNTLVALFSRAMQPPRKTVLGLWAELFLICQSRDPARLIRCWHAVPEDRFDFADGPQRIEVKAASGRVRIHTFALEQVRPPDCCVAIVASITVEHSAGGQTITDLLDEIRLVVGQPEMLIRLDSVVSQTMGTEWRQANTIAFDRQLAKDSLRFFDARDIPSVATNLPPEVSDVHFRVDLTQQPPATPLVLAAHGNLILAATAAADSVD